MQQRVQISDNSTEDLVGVGLFSIFTPALIILMIHPLSSSYVLPVCLIFWLSGILIILIKRFNDQIEFDGHFFYVSSWQGRAKAMIPLATISSVIHSEWGYRFYYTAPGGKKGYFYLSPNEWFCYDQLEDELKVANPYVYISSFHFKGFYFLVFRNEEWYK